MPDFSIAPIAPPRPLYQGPVPTAPTVPLSADRVPMMSAQNPALPQGPVAPIAPRAPTPNPSLNPKASKAAADAYANSAFNDWYASQKDLSQFHPGELSGVVDPVQANRFNKSPSANQYNTTLEKGTGGMVRETMKPLEGDELQAQIRANARAHFNAHVLPGDEHYQSMTAPPVGIVPTAPMPGRVTTRQPLPGGGYQTTVTGSPTPPAPPKPAAPARPVDPLKQVQADNLKNGVVTPVQQSQINLNNQRATAATQPATKPSKQELYGSSQERYDADRRQRAEEFIAKEVAQRKLMTSDTPEQVAAYEAELRGKFGLNTPTTKPATQPTTAPADNRVAPGPPMTSTGPTPAPASSQPITGASAPSTYTNQAPLTPAGRALVPGASSAQPANAPQTAPNAAPASQPATQSDAPRSPQNGDVAKQINGNLQVRQNNQWVDIPRGNGQPMTEDHLGIAAAFLKAAGGDKEAARNLARSYGWKI